MFGSIDLLRMKLMSDRNSTEIGHHSLLRDLRRTSQSHPFFLVLSQPVTKQFTLLRPESHRELLHKVTAETYPAVNSNDIAICFADIKDRHSYYFVSEAPEEHIKDLHLATGLEQEMLKVFQR